MSLDLRPYLESIGLQVTRQRGDEIGALCPAHLDRVGKADTHASFDFNQAKQVGNCYSCGFAPTFTELVIVLTGSAPTFDVITDVRIESAASKIAPITEAKREILAPSPWGLMHWYADVPERVLVIKRLTLAAAAAYHLRWDKELHCYVIPVYSISASLDWIQLRQKHGVMNVPEGVLKSNYLYNIHNVIEEEIVALCESPLDVVRLGAAGIPAVSSFGAAVSDRQITLLQRHFPRVVLALDNDAAGRKGIEFATHRLRSRKTAVHLWRYDTQGWDNAWKDPGDCKSDDMLRNVWQRTLRFGL